MCVLLVLEWELGKYRIKTVVQFPPDNNKEQEIKDSINKK